LTTDTWTKTRSQLANLSKILDSDDPRVIELRRELRAQRLADHVAKIIAEFPPLTPEQVDHVAGILRAGSGAA
jgi:hypothetical protein